MKHISRLFFFCLLLPLFVHSCEDKSKAEPSVKAVRMELTLKKYHNEAGAISSRLWERNDKVTFINTAAPEEIYTASPITPGSAASLFTVSVKSPENGDVLFAYLPNTAEVSFNAGKASLNIPGRQDGTVNPVYVGKTVYPEGSSTMMTMEMSPLYTVLYASIDKGNYSITKAVLTGNGGEKIAGKVDVDPADMSVSASEGSVTVEFTNGLDCREKGQSFPIMIAPVTLNKGYTIRFTTDNGTEIEYKTEESISCEMGGKVVSGAAANTGTQLLFCGDNMIYLIDAELALAQGYKNAILWDWDAKTEAGTIGKGMIRLDDCKPVDNKTKILATSSQDYAVLLDFNTKKLLWYSNNSDNAHSAELLPDNRIAIACSDGGDCIQIFDVSGSNKVLFSTPLASAHGVVWNPATERLYAVGGTSLNIYTLTDWKTSLPKLTLEKTVSTKGYVTSLHDLSLVDDNTLLLAGSKAAFYNIKQGTFQQLPHFGASNAIKAVNYNPENGECWYTDATGSDRELTWSSNDIRYTSNTNVAGWEKNIWIGDLNMYKVRVFNW